MASGRNLKLYWAKESTFGTAPATANALIKVTNFDAQLKYENVVSEARVGSRFAPEAYNVGKLGEFNTDIEVYPDTIGYILKAVLGDVSKSGSGTDYIHTFTPQTSETPISVTLQEVLASLHTKNYLGAVIDSFDFEVKVKSIINAKLSGFFQDEETATEYTGLSFSTKNPFIAHQAAVEIDDVANAYLKNFTLNFKNNIKNDDYRLNGTKKVANFPVGSAVATGSLEFTTDYTTILDKYTDLTAFKLEIIITSDELYDTDSYYKLELIMPYVFLTDAKINRDKDYMTITANYQACYDGTNAPLTFKLYDNNSTGY